jgi:hypothetical protein
VHTGEPPGSLASRSSRTISGKESAPARRNRSYPAATLPEAGADLRDEKPPKRDIVPPPPPAPMSWLFRPSGEDMERLSLQQLRRLIALLLLSFISGVSFASQRDVNSDSRSPAESNGASAVIRLLARPDKTELTDAYSNVSATGGEFGLPWMWWWHRINAGWGTVRPEVARLVVYDEKSRQCISIQGGERDSGFRRQSGGGRFRRGCPIDPQ